MDDILLVSNGIDLLLETLSFLLQNFETKDLGDTSFVIGIQIQRDRTRGILGLLQKAYNKVLDRCNRKNCSKGDKLSLLQCPKNDLQKEQIKGTPYASWLEV